MHSDDNEASSPYGDACFWACIASYFAGVFSAILAVAYISLTLS